MKRSIDAIYGSIPKVKGCRTGCADCCGPVPMIPAEAAAVKHMLRPEPYTNGDSITPLKPGCATCAYATPAGCSIYQDRPFMCRLFGAVEGEPSMTCPHGAKAKRPLSAAQAEALAMEYMALGE